MNNGRPAPLTSVRVSLNPLMSESSPPDKLNVPLTSTESYNNVHVLTLFPNTSITQIATNKVEDQLNSVEKFISQQCPYPDSKAYRTCEVATRAEVHQHLASLASRVNELDNSHARTLYEEAIELYNYAETVFDLFLPLSFDGPTTRKFWGAVRLLTVVSLPSSFLAGWKALTNGSRFPNLTSIPQQRHLPDPLQISVYSSRI